MDEIIKECCGKPESKCICIEDDMSMINIVSTKNIKKVGEKECQKK